ncbi:MULTISPECIES: SIMPL domain-containing protein [Micrococcaceae]|uniref:SIMPL domain-containing protein n=1 Tax=Arthrobacter sedimenti TaxID=2694931 RepID=A0ABV8WJ49_9MICC|nr:SIMPL domain-containing protein [Pseudarthrobacter defluvii]WJH25825.1 SIMPL domain-containing protein [Pseudarthrobacter defluvii]
MVEDPHVQVGAGTVTVTGTGSAEAAPDLMLVSVGVECRAGSVQEAYAAAGGALAAVGSALRGRGVAPADLRTAGLSVRADLAWRDGEGQKLVGYVAAGSLLVRLKDLSSASGTVSEAVRAAGDAARLNSLQLVLSDDSAIRAQARDAAWEDAFHTAGQYAALASATLGRVLSVTDQRPASGPVPLAGLQRTSATESLAVEPGENRVDAAVTVTWELQR